MAIGDHRGERLCAGVDFGTSGCRLAIINSSKELIFDHQVHYAKPDQQNPAIWWDALKTLFAKCPANLKKQISRIAVDGTSGTLLLVDEIGHPVSKTLMYNDTRASDQAAIIASIAPEESGARGASSGLARFLWLLQHSQQNSAYRVQHQADWIVGKFTNAFRHSDENNCLKLGYDLMNRCWPDWFTALKIPLQLLPEVHQPGKVITKIAPEVANQLGLSNDLDLVAGTTDSIAAFLATGANQLGEAVTSLGSTLAIKLISDKPVFSPQYGIYSHRLGDRWLVGGASNSGGAVLLKYFKTHALDRMTAGLDPAKTTGLKYYPLLKKGERFPIADPNKQPLLTPRPNNDIQFFQGMLEGIANIEKLAYQRLNELGAPKLSKLYTVGGGSQNIAWTKIREQKLELSIITPNITEAAYGVALLALQATD